jgi:hypothetical protein
VAIRPAADGKHTLALLFDPLEKGRLGLALAISIF